MPRRTEFSGLAKQQRQLYPMAADVQGALSDVFTYLADYDNGKTYRDTPRPHIAELAQASARVGQGVDPASPFVVGNDDRVTI